MLSKHVRLILTFAFLGTLGTTGADAGEPLQRVFRFFGVGWGDGYHTCADGGCRPGADLSPASFYTQFGQRKHIGGGGGGGWVRPVGGPAIYSETDSSYGVGGTPYPRCSCGAGIQGSCGCASAPPVAYHAAPVMAQPAPRMPMQHAHTSHPVATPPPGPVPASEPVPADAEMDAEPEPLLLDENDLEEEPTSPSDQLLMQRRINAQFVSQMRQLQQQRAAQQTTLQHAPPIIKPSLPQYNGMQIHSNRSMIQQVPYRIPSR